MGHWPPGHRISSFIHCTSSTAFSWLVFISTQSEKDWLIAVRYDLRTSSRSIPKVMRRIDWPLEKSIISSRTVNEVSISRSSSSFESRETFLGFGTVEVAIEGAGDAGGCGG